MPKENMLFLKKKLQKLSIVLLMSTLVGCSKEKSNSINEGTVLLNLDETEKKCLPPVEDVQNLLCEKNTNDLLVSSLIPNVDVTGMAETKTSYGMLSEFYGLNEQALPFFYQEVALLNALQIEDYTMASTDEMILAEKDLENFYIEKEWFLAEKKDSQSYESLEASQNTTNYLTYMSYYVDLGNDNFIFMGTDYSNGQSKLIINLYTNDTDFDYDNPLIFAAPINSNADLLAINAELMTYYQDQFDYDLLLNSTIGKTIQKQNPYMFNDLFQILDSIPKNSQSKKLLS